MPSTAPKAAPADTPRMSGETSGLRNRPWYAAPDAASAAPTSKRGEDARTADAEDDRLDCRRQRVRGAGELRLDDERRSSPGTHRIPSDRERGEHERREQRDRTCDREAGACQRQPRRGSAVRTSASSCSGVGV